MTNRIQQITIVGGGTAGWLTAMILNRFLNPLDREPSVQSPGVQSPGVQINVIESPKIPTIGVGEATVPAMPNLLQQLGINETEFLRRCNASFKMGVRFDHWGLDQSGDPLRYYHPFNYPRGLAGWSPAYHFNKFGPQVDGADFADCMAPNSAIIKEHRGPRPLAGGDYESAIGYSYHLDASLFAKLLRDVAATRGIRHIRDDVVEVLQDEQGFISHLRLEQGGLFPVELVVDCTGFKGLILQQILNEPFVSIDQHLLCDRAIPVQIPHRDPTRIEPCTRSTGLGAGWVWRVPLYNRLGTGYVFSSAFRTDEEAKAEFFQHLRAIGDLPPDAPDPEAPVIHMKTGRTQRAWVKNCVAIGLSGSFVEPLEATAIFVVEMAARWLAAHLPDRSFNPAVANQYNQLNETLFDEIRDFIISHYYTSNRTEPFWQAARSEGVLTDPLKEKLELWRHILPNSTDTTGSRLFGFWNYTYTLWAKGFFKDKHYPLENAISITQWDRFGAEVATEKQRLLSLLPDHYELLSHIRDPRPTAAEGFDMRPKAAHQVYKRTSVPIS